MSNFRIAAAQSTSIPADLERNIPIHLRFIEAAREAGVEVLVFPELSLCGYELPRLGECITAPDDARLAPIREMAIAASMTVIVGAAVAGSAPGMPAIGAITFFPEGNATIYRKRHLHSGEEQFAQAGQVDAYVFRRNEHALGLAICADTSHSIHAAAAAADGATLYVASVLVSESGYAADSANLEQYAQNLQMGVLMANHGAPSGGFASAGRSAFWAADGKLVIAADGPGNCLVVADYQAGDWTGHVLPVAA